MPRVEAWECPHTGTLFAIADTNKYRSHLARLAKERKAQAKRDAYLASFDVMFEQAKQTCRTPDDIAKWLKDNFEAIYERHKSHSTDKLSADFEIQSVNMAGRYRESCSNSHSAPRGKKQNWGGTRLEHDGSPVPRGYPGLTGNFAMRYKGELDGFLSSVLTSVGIATGSGGGEPGYSHYTLILWLDDWPALKQYVEEQLIMSKLNGKTLNRIDWSL